jgi:Kef-type K+ transport system membrane component KefB
MAQIALIILVSRAVGSLIEGIGQPRVIGEVLAGILLGPSFLGWVAPGLSALLFPPTSFGVLNALSQCAGKPLATLGAPAEFHTGRREAVP